MIVECYQRRIGCDEWIMQKIAYASYVTSRDEEILENLKFVRRKLKYTEDKKPRTEKLDEIIKLLS